MKKSKHILVSDDHRQFVRFGAPFRGPGIRVVAPEFSSIRSNPEDARGASKVPAMFEALVPGATCRTRVHSTELTRIEGHA
jgi:hypothetical protein